LLLQIDELDESARAACARSAGRGECLAAEGAPRNAAGWQPVSAAERQAARLPTIAATRQMLQLGSKYIRNDQPRLLRDLYAVCCARSGWCACATRNHAEGQNASLLYLHVPLTIALLAALFAHVVAILYYW